MRLALLAAGAPLQPDADEARRAAQQELARQVYRDAEPGIVQRLWQSLLDVLDGVGAPSGGPAVQALVVVALVVGVLVVVLLLVRQTGAVSRRAAVGEGPALSGPATAGQLRLAARRAAAEGRFDDAVVEGFRALVRGLQERDLVPSEPGLTAAEAVRAAARELPGMAERLALAGGLFDGVLYGGSRASADDAAEVTSLDDAVARARPARVPAP